MFFLVTGKGGVGKTTISLYIARKLSRKGRTILYYDYFSPDRAIYKIDKKKWGDFEIKKIDYMEELVEYLKIKIKFLHIFLVRSRIFKVFSGVIPGLKETVIIGRIWYDYWRKVADYFVLDGYPLGQIQTFLKIPSAIKSSGIGGIIFKDVDGMDKMIREAKIFVVTTPEELPIEETLESSHFLKNFDTTYILNKFYNSNLSYETRQWIRRMLIEGKMSEREREELYSSLMIDEKLSEKSKIYLEKLREVGNVITFPFLFFDEKNEKDEKDIDLPLV